MIKKLKSDLHYPLNYNFKNSYSNIDDLKYFLNITDKIIDYINKKFISATLFNANVAHELKTPLSKLKIDLEYISNCKKLEYHTNIKNCLKQIDNLDEVITQILLLSNANIKNIYSSMKRVLLNDIVYMAIDDCDSIKKDKNIKIHLDIPIAVSIHGDKNLLRYAIYNILDNAIKYSKKNQEVCIFLKEKKKYIYLLIKDYGLGMRKSEKKLIFRPYYRGENTYLTGYGLGLSLASRIFQIHNADIKIKTQKDSGTLVIIKFHIW